MGELLYIALCPTVGAGRRWEPVKAAHRIDRFVDEAYGRGTKSCVGAQFFPGPGHHCSHMAIRGTR